MTSQTTTPAQTRARFAAIVLIAAGLAGCGGSDDPAPAASASATPAPAPTSPAPTPTPAPTPAPPPVATIDAAKALLAAADALWASAVPTAAQRMSLTDGCYLSDGQTKAFTLTALEANAARVAARDAYRIGEQRSNVQIVPGTEQTLTNPDGSTRKLVKVEYDITYADGSTGGDGAWMMTGSSAGTPGCTTPQTGDEWRLFGNQLPVRAEPRARILRNERLSLLTGAPQTNSVQYRRDIQFFVNDPMGNATYVIVTGPGPSGPNGEPFSLKLISPRLLKSAPELAGKNGNFLNWADDESFRFCRIVGAGVPVASIADCVGQGATGNNWGWTTTTPNAAADAGFASQGWTAGGRYIFSVYNDDGWKTVNGHQGKTPIATVEETLDALPLTFVAMAGNSPSDDNFPTFTAPSDAAQVAANIRSAMPLAMNAAWTPLDAAALATGFRLFSTWEYFEGPKVGSTAPLFPGYRSSIDQYPGSLATSLSGWPVSAALPDMTAKTYAEFGLAYVDRGLGRVLSYVSFF